MNLDERPFFLSDFHLALELQIVLVVRIVDNVQFFLIANFCFESRGRMSLQHLPHNVSVH